MKKFLIFSFLILTNCVNQFEKYYAPHLPPRTDLRTTQEPTMSITFNPYDADMIGRDAEKIGRAGYKPVGFTCFLGQSWRSPVPSKEEMNDFAKKVKAELATFYYFNDTGAIRMSEEWEREPGELKSIKAVPQEGNTYIFAMFYSRPQSKIENK